MLPALKREAYITYTDQATRLINERLAFFTFFLTNYKTVKKIKY